MCKIVFVVDKDVDITSLLNRIMMNEFNQYSNHYHHPIIDKRIKEIKVNNKIKKILFWKCVGG